ncbi:MAG: flagellar motor protein MotB [Bacilli bacterium]
MRRIRKKGSQAKANHERWLITYSDLITLLLIFFVIMYAMSKIDVAKFLFTIWAKRRSCNRKTRRRAARPAFRSSRCRRSRNSSCVRSCMKIRCSAISLRSFRIL